MAENQPLNENSSAVQTHLTMMQGVITRMAENSRSCKVWCVTLVAAVLVLVARTGEPQHALIALVPTLLFLFLDSYYLALERAFVRELYTVLPALEIETVGRHVAGVRAAAARRVSTQPQKHPDYQEPGQYHPAVESDERIERRREKQADNHRRRRPQ